MKKLIGLLSFLIMFSVQAGMSFAYTHTYDSAASDGYEMVVGSDTESLAFDFDLVEGGYVSPPSGFKTDLNDVSGQTGTPPFDPPVTWAAIVGNATGSGLLRASIILFADGLNMLDPVQVYQGPVAGPFSFQLGDTLVGFLNMDNGGWGKVYLTVVDNPSTPLIDPDTDLATPDSLYITRMGVTASPVPVPAAVYLLGTGLVALIGIRRRKRPA